MLNEYMPRKSRANSAKTYESCEKASKPSPTSACDSDASLPDALNVIYAQFEAENNVVAKMNTPPSQQTSATSDHS